MAVRSGVVAVSHTTVSPIVPAANPNANPSGFNPGTASVVVSNLDGAITVYLGGSAVDATGFPLLKGASVTLALGPGDGLYGLAASGTPNVAWIATG